MNLKRIATTALILCLTSVLHLSAQTHNVSGTVKWSDVGNPLPGVSVVIRNTNKGTTTDYQGRYSLVAMKGDTLDFRFIGMKPMMKIVGNATKINVEMDSASEDIDEVVVVGYSLMKKSDLTGSVQNVTSDELMKSRPASLEQGLQGRIAGVNVVRNDGAPGGGISVQIRGSNSFMGSTEPLYVIDGVPFTASNDEESMTFDENEVASRNVLSFLDPENIESVEILKDASAVALYGSRGSNGVVMITTKTGRKGSNRLTFNATLSISQVSNKLRMLTGAEYAEYRNQAYINTQYINTGSFNPQGLPHLGDVGPQGTYVKGPKDYENDPYYWQDAIFRTAISQNYSLNYSGATNNGDYSIGLSYLDQTGTVINSGYDRLNVNLKLNQNIKSWLKIGTSTNFSMANSDMIKTATSNQNNGDEGVIRSALYYPPLYKIEEQPGYEEYQLVSNPLDYTAALNKNRNYTIYSSNYANATLMKGLIFRTVFSYKASINFNNRYFPKNLYEGRSVGGKSLAGDIQSQRYLWDNFLMFNRTFKNVHNVSATLGVSWEDYSYYSKQVTTQGFGYDGNNGWILDEGTAPQTPQSVKQDATLFSVIARAAYTYANKYYVTATFRRDESSKFAKNNKAAYFPSIGVAWTISREKFLKESSAVTNLKLRYSYGTSGNAGIGPYGSLLLFGSANYPFGSGVSSGYAIEGTNPGNPDLKWETTYQHDLGLELSLFNVLDLEVDFYDKTTKDLIQNKDLSPSSGMKSVLMNIGEVNNRGVEITANARVLNRNDFHLNIGGNISFNRNEVTDLNGLRIFPNNLWNDLRPYILEEGHPIGQLYGYVEEGIWNTREEVIQSKQFQTQYPGYSVEDNDEGTELIIKQKWLGEVRIHDKNGDGEINDADQDYIGDVNPKFIYAFNVDFSYKNFDLSVLFNGVSGNDIINMPSLRNYNLGQTRNIPKSILDDAWVPGGSGNSPKIYTTTSRDLYFSRRYIEDGSYLKLRNVSLGYTFKKPIKGIGSLRLYVSLNNLWTITDYSGYDPEVNAFGTNPSRRGVDAGGYPQSKEYLFGINLTL
ncbi:SusC/RagA family TonB-linked outer membrane protein [Alistipes megaguti]|uniref:SusC/RagA family TonB-linked outer membrane protein n=1 Tax=Alistipes megaguti TaxID=2364787 RepID=UPI0023529026|nr:TonB-dependent receptor [Alistipes megaguti]